MQIRIVVKAFSANGHPDPRHWLKVKVNLLQKWFICIPVQCTVHCGDFVNLLYDIVLVNEISTESFDTDKDKKYRENVVFTDKHKNYVS
jgi:hypothetical protein